MTLKKTILIFTFSITSQLLYSKTQDSLLLNKVLKQLKIQKKEVNLEFVSDKILPYSKDKSKVFQING